MTDGDLQFDLAESWKHYESILPVKNLAAMIELAVSLWDEPLLWVIPSIVWTQDGPRLESVFLVADEAFCQVQTANVFRFRTRSKFEQIRWFVRNEKAKLDGCEIDMQSAILEITQHGERLALSYAGAERDTWVESAREAFPWWLVKY